ncbi:MAG: imidazole glycerol phosphate synthase subunit HisF [Treponema sp.]|jgi:cyclase|nr:imidazole glycerol phosphate synthase subunit HisF [Treponema sp.]
MKTKRIVAAIDIDNGRVVKGVKFENIKDIGDPVELALKYNADGADEIAFLDIGASGKNRAILLDVVQKIAASVNIPFCVAGGIRTLDDMRAVMDAGANKTAVCTSALLRPQLLSEMAGAYGSKSVIISIDAKRMTNDRSQEVKWNAFSGGGKTDSGLDAVEWAIKAVQLGAGEIMLNSIDADGTGEGYDLELIRSVTSAVSVPVIASGGAGTLEQIADVLLNTNADAALVASVLHFGKTTIKEIKNYAESKGICIRK